MAVRATGALLLGMHALEWLLREPPAPPDDTVPYWARIAIALLAVVVMLLIGVLAKLEGVKLAIAQNDIRRHREDMILEARRRTVDTSRRSTEHAPDFVPTIRDMDAQAARLKELMREVRYIEAQELVEELLGQVDADPENPVARQAAQALAGLRGEGGPLASLQHLAGLCRGAIGDVNEDAGWTLASDRDGTKVQFKRTSTTLSVKIDAFVEGVRPGDALYAWREVELYPSWFPLITGSRVLAELSEVDVVLQLEVDTWFSYSDIVARGFGCDHLKEGCFLIVVRPVEQEDMPEVAFPPFAYRRRLFPPMRVPTEINVLVEPLSASSVRFAYSLCVARSRCARSQGRG